MGCHSDACPTSRVGNLLQPLNLYRAPNRVERFFDRTKRCHRVATRYDKLAANYIAFVQLSSIRLWFAARYESTP
jgi:transposase